MSALHAIRTAVLCGAATAGVACGETTIAIESAEPANEPAVDLERELLAYFPFDETEPGPLALDASGLGHHGVPSENPPLPSLAVPPVGFDNPRSLAFDGIDQLIDLGNPPSLNVSGEVTLSAWIRPSALDGYRNIVVHGFRWMPYQELALRIHEGDFEFTSWDGIDHMVTTPVPPGDVDNWHHVAGVYDGRTYRLYRDGQLLAEHEEGFAPIQVDAPWAIGGRSTPVPPETRFFAGFIDEVRIYGRALTEDEVRALFRR